MYRILWLFINYVSFSNFEEELAAEFLKDYKEMYQNVKCCLVGGRITLVFIFFFFAYPYFLQQTEETINVFPLVPKK